MFYLVDPLRTRSLTQDFPKTPLNSGTSTSFTSKGTAVSDVSAPASDSSSIWEDIKKGIKEGFESFATSAVDAEKKATSDANDLTKEWIDAQNQFNSDEAEAQRTWSNDQRVAAQEYQTAERLAAQGYNTEMSNTSFQRVVRDLKAAGLNPALAFQLGGASTPTISGGSAVTVSGSSASGSMSSAQKSNVASAKNSDIKLISDLFSGAVSVLNNITTSAVKLIGEFIPG